MTKIQDYPGLSERVERYRKLAVETREQASQCRDEDMRASFLMIAKGWDRLADQLDQRLN
jgi:hypothetical protein